MNPPLRIKTITEAHQLLGLPKPKHPLVSVVQHQDMRVSDDFVNVRYSLDLYYVSCKEGFSGAMRYGRSTYDFHEGTMLFIKPGQVMAYDGHRAEGLNDAWSLLFHPDLIRKSGLGQTIDHYSFFNYDVNEALHLSDDEKKSLFELVRKIEKEYQQNIDRHSQKLIVSNIELLLDYCTRYYDRQFYTRTNLNKDFISKFEQLLKAYYNSDRPFKLGIPSVKYCGREMNMSPNYLSDLLKKETGKNTREHIHDYLIDKAKTQLIGSTIPISQIAYDLGFEYSQHFSKMFKRRTGMSPSVYRQSN